MRIEVGIENDHGVCAPQIDPDSSSTRCQHVYEHIRAWFVELVHSFLSIALLRTSILEEAVEHIPH